MSVAYVAASLAVTNQLQSQQMAKLFVRVATESPGLQSLLKPFKLHQPTLPAFNNCQLI